MSLYSSAYSILRTTSPREQMRKRLGLKLRAMKQHSDGWSFGDGGPVTDQAIAVAEDFVLLAVLLDLEADVFPNLDGGCAIAFYSGEDSVEVSVNGDVDTLGLRVERGIGFQYEDVIEPSGNVSVKDVYSQVVQLAQGDRWMLPGFFTSDTSTPESNDLEIQSSSIPDGEQMETPLLTIEGGSQSSKLLVPALT